MNTFPIPTDEKERLEAVHRMAILDTQPESRFDSITKEATRLLDVSISTITILDSKREWFKSCTGLDQTEADRAISFCAYALVVKDLFIVNDTLEDERFKNNPMVIGHPYIRFYAGQSLLDFDSGHAVGVFCIKDTKPRSLSLEQIGIFLELARKAETEINKKRV